MELTKVLYSVDGNIATIAMNSPPNLNAFDEVMIDELVEAMRLVAEDDCVKVVLLTSAIKAFSAGGDIGTMYKGIKSGNFNFEELLNKMADVTIAIKKLPKPVICAVKGSAAGAGFIVPLACDYVIAEENASFMLAFVNLGLIPDVGGLYLLSRAIGVNKAAELAMTGRLVSAQEAKSLGFVAEVAPAEQFDEAVQKALKRFSRGPSHSYAEIKRLLWESEFKNFEAYIKEEVKSQLLCSETDDFVEGVCAFVEKRKANFK